MRYVFPHYQQWQVHALHPVKQKLLEIIETHDEQSRLFHWSIKLAGLISSHYVNLIMAQMDLDKLKVHHMFTT